MPLPFSAKMTARVLRLIFCFLKKLFAYNDLHNFKHNLNIFNGKLFLGFPLVFLEISFRFFYTKKVEIKENISFPTERLHATNLLFATLQAKALKALIRFYEKAQSKLTT